MSTANNIVTAEMKRKARIHVWQDNAKGGFWFWSLIGTNGRPLMSCPPKGFSSRRNAHSAFSATVRILDARSIVPVAAPPTGNYV